MERKKRPCCRQITVCTGTLIISVTNMLYEMRQMPAGHRSADQRQDIGDPEPADRHDQDHGRNHIRDRKIPELEHTKAGCQQKYAAGRFEIIELPDLPEPTCDWSLFESVELPAPEIRHYVSDAGGNLYVRNLYETRRMAYTLYNALGRTPEAWRDGKPLFKISTEIYK